MFNFAFREKQKKAFFGGGQGLIYIDIFSEKKNKIYCCMKKVFLKILLFFCIISCSFGKMQKENPTIDVLNSVDNYNKVYFSDYFSSIELIPLETNENCLLDIIPSPSVILNDSIILFSVTNRLYVFDRTGKFLNQVGERGQGPNEYIFISDFFLNKDNSNIYITDLVKVLEYNVNGTFVSSFMKPVVDSEPLSYCSYIGENIFIGQKNYNGTNECKYYLFNNNGVIVKCFPNYILFNKKDQSLSTIDGSLIPVWVDNQLFLKDFINDTIYTYTNSILQPAYIFDFGKYSIPKDNWNHANSKDFFIFSPGFGNLVGTPKFFFYKITIPDIFSGPKSKPTYNHLLNVYKSSDRVVYGIYNKEKSLNILLDTDDHLQKGFINDINGGLSFIPRFYAGNDIVIDIWNPTDMKEMLTEAYFKTRTIKDQQAYQKLKDLLKNLKEDDNPVIVVAKLKK